METAVIIPVPEAAPTVARHRWTYDPTGRALRLARAVKRSASSQNLLATPVGQVIALAVLALGGFGAPLLGGLRPGIATGLTISHASD
jgi:hypothetical protein